MLERQQAIHFALFAKTYPTSDELALELEIDESTVRRYIRVMIRRMNLPIAWNYKEKGWNYTKEVALFLSVLKELRRQKRTFNHKRIERLMRVEGLRAGILHHSDRGVQYASESYRQMLSAFELEASMSRLC